MKRIAIIAKALTGAHARRTSIANQVRAKEAIVATKPMEQATRHAPRAAKKAVFARNVTVKATFLKMATAKKQPPLLRLRPRPP